MLLGVDSLRGGLAEGNRIWNGKIWHDKVLPNCAMAFEKVASMQMQNTSLRVRFLVCASTVLVVVMWMHNVWKGMQSKF